MCYSKDYTSSDGIQRFFRIGTDIELAACKTSYNMSGGRRKKKNKTKRKKHRKSRRKKI